MDRTEAFAVLRDATATMLNVDATLVVEAASFKDDLDADSLDIIELVMELEERFEIEVPEDDLEGVTTVGHALDLVVAKLAARV